MSIATYALFLFSSLASFGVGLWFGYHIGRNDGVSAAELVDAMELEKDVEK